MVYLRPVAHIALFVIYICLVGSSPYILKMYHDIICEDEETEENEMVRCTNYQVCDTVETARV